MDSVHCPESYRTLLKSDLVELSKETVVKQFFTDFLENLGDNPDGEEEMNIEEANFILTDLFFAGLLDVGWDPRGHKLILKHIDQSK